MLKRTIAYKDYNGVERKEDFYFNLTEEEIITSEVITPGGLRNYLQQIIDAKDGGAIMTYMRKFIEMSYGIKSADGRRFEKSPEISKAFMETQAFNKLFMELVASENAAEKAADFVNAIMPDVPENAGTAATPQITQNV